MMSLLVVVILLVCLSTLEASGGFFFGSNSNRGNSEVKEPKALQDDSNLYITDDELSDARRKIEQANTGGGYFTGSSFSSLPSTKKGPLTPDEEEQRRLANSKWLKAQQQREYDYDDRYYDDTDKVNNRRSRISKNEDADSKPIKKNFVYEKGEMGLNFDNLGGSFPNLYGWARHLPTINLHIDPIINFKMKQKISQFGTCITLGIDYLSEISQWRAYCAVEDTIIGGRFSIRGSELGWTKSWFHNLGLGEESNAKIKLRMGLNLKDYKMYARVRFRTEPLSTFDIGDGLSCAGKLPVPGVLAIFNSLPARIEYRFRINTPPPEFEMRRGKRDGTISLSTGNFHTNPLTPPLPLPFYYDYYSAFLLRLL